MTVTRRKTRNLSANNTPKKKQRNNAPSTADSDKNVQTVDLTNDNSTDYDSDISITLKKDEDLDKDEFFASENEGNKTKGKKSKRTNASNLVNEYLVTKKIREDEILEQLKGEENNLKEVKETAKKWINLYTYDKNTALYNLMGLIVVLTGSDQILSSESITADCDFDRFLKEVETAITKKNKKKDLGMNIEKKTIGKAVKMIGYLIKFSRENLLQDEFTLDLLINFMCSFSKSKYRVIRQMFAAITIQIITSLSEIEKEIIKGIKSLEKQQKNKEKSKKKIAALKLNRLDIEKIMSAFFDGVYVQRYRDVDSSIRILCLKAIKTWITILPEVHLKNSNLKYLVWALSDKIGAVRKECLFSVLFIVLKKEFNTVVVMDNFIEKLKDRILEMALKDVDNSVVSCALLLVDAIYTMGKISDREVFELLNCTMFKRAHKTREVSGALFHNYLKNQRNVSCSNQVKDDDSKIEAEKLNQLNNLVQAAASLIGNQTNNELTEEFENEDFPSPEDLNNHFLLKNIKLQLFIESVWKKTEIVRDVLFMVSCLTSNSNPIVEDLEKTTMLTKMLGLSILKIISATSGSTESEKKQNDLLKLEAVDSIRDKLLDNDNIMLMLNASNNKEQTLALFFVVHSALDLQSFIKKNKLQLLISVLNEVRTANNSNTFVHETFECFRCLKALTTLDSDTNEVSGNNDTLLVPMEVASFLVQIKSDVTNNLNSVLQTKSRNSSTAEAKLGYELKRLYAITMVYYELLSEIDVFDGLIRIANDHIKNNVCISFYAYEILYYSFLLAASKTEHYLENTTDELGSRRDRLQELGHKTLAECSNNKHYTNNLAESAASVIFLRQFYMAKTVFVHLNNLLASLKGSDYEFDSHAIEQNNSLLNEKLNTCFLGVWNHVIAHPDTNNAAQLLKTCLDVIVVYTRTIMLGVFDLQNLSNLTLLYVGKSKAFNKADETSLQSQAVLDKCIEHFFSNHLKEELKEHLTNNNREQIEILMETMFWFVIEKFDQWYTTNIPDTQDASLLVACSSMAKVLMNAIDTSNNLLNSKLLSEIMVDAHLKVIRKILPTLNDYIQQDSAAAANNNTEYETQLIKDPTKIFFVLESFVSESSITSEDAYRLIELMEFDFNEAMISLSRDSTVYFTFYTYHDRLEQIASKNKQRPQ